MFQLHRRLPLIRAIAVIATATLASTGPVAQAHDPAEDANPNQGKMSFSAGVDVTSHYFFRGIIQEDQGLITQPWLEGSASLSDSVSLTFGIWNSFHDVKTLRDGGAGSDGAGPDSWYEADLYIGLSCSAVENFEFGLVYTAYTSPNDAFSTVQELALSAGYDDSGMWQDTPIASGLQPSVTVALELDGQADAGSNEGIYLELAVAPSFVVVESKTHPVTLSVPITLGLSLGDYYEDPTSAGAADDSNFGYLDIGLVVSTPLTSVPADFGQWELSAGVHYLLLNEATEELNQSANGDEIIFAVGIRMGY